MKTIIKTRATPANETINKETIVLFKESFKYISKRQDASDLYQKARYKLIYNLETIFLNPRWFLVFLLGRFNFIRQLYLWISSLLSPSIKFAEKTSLFDRIDSNLVVKTLKRDGIYIDFSLPPDLLENLLQRIKTENCFAGGHPNLGFNILEKDEVDRVYQQPFYVARYFNISSGWSEIARLATDSKVLEIASRYIGQPAKYTGSSLFWTFPISGTSYDCDQQKFSYFHYDLDDFASLRFCFYLTDVDEESGPHLCIRGSHLKKSFFHVWNFFTRIQSPEKLYKFYGIEKLVTIKGKCGTGFIEDTFCFHKGIPPQTKPRLFLQLHFAANNYSHANYLDDRDPSSLKHFQE